MGILRSKTQRVAAGAATTAALATSAVAVPAAASHAAELAPVQPVTHSAKVKPAVRSRAVARHARHARHARASNRHVVVRTGDSLWAIAQRVMGGGRHWPALYRANAQVIGSDPNVIRVGQVLRVPAPPFGGGAVVTIAPARPSADGDGDHDHDSAHHARVRVTVSGTLNGSGLIAVARYLMSHGATRAAAAGICGDIDGESAGNPESVGSGGFGLIGWTGNTIGLPAGYHGPTGNYGYDLAAQSQGVVGYIDALGGFGPINAAGGVIAAEDEFSRAYERPANPLSDTRDSVALSIYSQL